AAVRGVHVRLLVDKNFYATYPETVNQLGSQANIQSRTIDFSQYGGIQHAKYFVADGNNAFVGSQNFDWRALSHIHEVGVRLTDPAVNSDLEKIFEKDWAAGVQVGSTKPAAAPPAIVAPVAPSGDLQVVASPSQANPAGIPDTLTQVVGLISGAHKSVRIQVMEYTTRGSKQGSPAWRALDNAVRKAASQGAQVQLLVDVSDLKKGGADLQALARLHGVEVKSVTIPAFSGGPIDYARLIHSKYLIVDGAVSWVGSENWSEGYFLETRNVGVLIRSQEATNQLIQIFDKVWTSSYATGV
ncbi:MAG: phospholipase D-like domain-containing protein, partial [Bdellovibrionota bacterium]